QDETLEDSGIAGLAETDLSRWHLDSSKDGQVEWTFDGSVGRNMGEQSLETQYWLSINQQTPLQLESKGNPLRSARNGFEFLKRIQSPDGHWRYSSKTHPHFNSQLILGCSVGYINDSCSPIHCIILLVLVLDMVVCANHFKNTMNHSPTTTGPLFLTPGLVIACYITKIALPTEFTTELLRYLAHHQRQGQDARDKGWGLNIHESSTVLGTALNYVACRLLGLNAQLPMLVRARTTLHALGGGSCLPIPTWGKVWLALLNIYDWEGVNPMPPESWLLPSILPFHPSRWRAHTRQVYLPMSYVAGRRIKADLDPLLQSLREELYTQPYEDIDWFPAVTSSHKPTCTPLPIRFLSAHFRCLLTGKKSVHKD
ncbi:hypothetical protein PSTT_01686, partial [Puccinia striiformis]